MTENETMAALFALTLHIAEDIYLQKCLFYNVPGLPDSNKKECIDEAVKALPEVLDYYKKVSEAAEGGGEDDDA